MATSALTKFNAFTHELGKGTHNFTTHAFKVAFTNTAPTVANSVLADITQIAAGGGYVAGGYALDSVSWTTSGGVAKLTIADEVVTASGAMNTFQYIVLYNDTAASKNLIGFANYGAGVTLGANEQFTIDLDDAGGVLTVT